MGEVAERFRRVAGDFSAVVGALEDDAWSNEAPCAGWTARDVVGHLVEWIPGPGFLLGSYDIDVADGPSVDADPPGAWLRVADAVQAALDDAVVAARVAECGPLGALSLESAVEMTVISDVLVHTWDVASAAGADARLDPDEVARQRAAVDAIRPEVDDAMRNSGHFGPRLAVADDADDLAIVLAFFGRDRHWKEPQL